MGDEHHDSHVVPGHADPASNVMAARGGGGAPTGRTAVRRPGATSARRPVGGRRQRHSHLHDAAGLETVSRAGRRRVLLALTLLLGVVTAATAWGLVTLWPHEPRSAYVPASAAAVAPGVSEVAGTVTSLTPFACSDVGVEGDPAATRQAVCEHAQVSLDSGPDRGQTVTVDIPSVNVSAGLHTGDTLRLLRLPPSPGQAAAVYTFSDMQRITPLLILAVAFTILVVLVARLRGLLALAGLAVAFVLIIRFVLPSLLTGHDPLWVGTTGSAAILLVVLYLAHGVSVRTSTALLGTLLGLGVAAALGHWAVSAAHLTGVSGEESLTVQAFAARTPLSGLVLCGIVIASLGVLNDVTVTQASAVWELRALQPAAGPGRLFTAAMRIGRDHIASSIYTIAFVYTGTALPVLLLLLLYQQPLSHTLGLEAVAEQIVSTLVGATALVLSVPFTTALAVTLARLAGRPVPVPQASTGLAVPSAIAAGTDFDPAAAI